MEKSESKLDGEIHEAMHQMQVWSPSIVEKYLDDPEDFARAQHEAMRQQIAEFMPSWVDKWFDTHQPDMSNHS